MIVYTIQCEIKASIRCKILCILMSLSPLRCIETSSGRCKYAEQHRRAGTGERGAARAPLSTEPGQPAHPATGPAPGSQPQAPALVPVRLQLGNERQWIKGAPVGTVRRVIAPKGRGHRSCAGPIGGGQPTPAFPWPWLQYPVGLRLGGGLRAVPRRHRRRAARPAQPPGGFPQRRRLVPLQPDPQPGRPVDRDQARRQPLPESRNRSDRPMTTGESGGDR